MEVLKIGGVDYSAHIEARGIGWSRNDVDSEKTVRVKNGTLRRDKITTKRKLSYQLVHMTRAELAALDNSLSAPTFTATYLDLYGQQTRTFYCSSFSAKLESAYSEDGEWVGASFDMIEV